MYGNIPLNDVDEYSQAKQSNMSWHIQKKSSLDFELDCKVQSLSFYVFKILQACLNHEHFEIFVVRG